MATDEHQEMRGSGNRVLRRAAAGGCLLVPAAALLWVPWYARTGPELWGMPFFYWYQFAWVPGTSVLLLVAWLLRREGPRRSRPPSG